MPPDVAPLHLPPERLAHFTAVRRRLHQIPELGYQEFDTAELIRAELAALGIEPLPGPDAAPTATLALLGDPARPCLALRADIDALPIAERTGKPYASTRPGRMHACGHDGHAANLLLTASVLKPHVDRLGVCVKLIFQPAEEGGGGAGRLVEAGVLDHSPHFGPPVRQIFGLHGFPGLPVGVVSTRPGPLMACTDNLRVTLRGSGCHGAFPHLGTDPIVAAAELVLSLQHFVSRELDPVSPGVVTVGTFHAGTASNVIPDEAVLEATVRTLNDTDRARAQAALTRRCCGIADAHGCTADIEYRRGYPATVNDPASADLVASVARTVLGPGSWFPSPTPTMGGEDFAYYLEKIPGAFFFVGVRPADRTDHPPLHSDRFDFNDDALPAATAMFVNLVHAFARSV